jgi:hypothetical protein
MIVEACLMIRCSEIGYITSLYCCGLYLATATVYRVTT